MDPDTGHDAVADVAIAGGHTTAIGQGLDRERVIDATRLVVAPGFIDLHAHGQSLPADRMQAFDGVTTTLELELGVLPVARWYNEQAHAGRMLNYGAEMANASEVADILARVGAGLDEGGIGIGFPNAYAPGTGVKEMSELCSLAAERGVPTYTHVAYMSNIDPRSSVEAYTRLIGYAGSTGAHMHIYHSTARACRMSSGRPSWSAPPSARACKRPSRPIRTVPARLW